MTDDLRERAGKALREQSARQARCLDNLRPWGGLSQSEQEYWCAEAEPVLKLGLAAGLREGAGIANKHKEEWDHSAVIYGDMRDSERTDECEYKALAAAHIVQAIESRAKEVEGT